MTTDICVTCRNHNNVLSSFVTMYKWPQIYVLLVVITTMSSPHSSMHKWPQIYVLLVYVQMTTDICVAYRNHNHVLSSFVTMYKWPHIYVLLFYVQMTTDICVTCRYHNQLLSSFVSMYKWRQIYVLLVVITTMSSPHSSLCKNDDRYMYYLS
jgi:hypothetical protein